MTEKTFPRYQYRCPGGHWTCSHERFVDGTRCEAIFGVPNSTVPVQCSGVYDEDTPCYVYADDFDVTVELLTDRIGQLEAAGDALTHSLLMFQSKFPDRDIGYDAITAWSQVRHA